MRNKDTISIQLVREALLHSCAPGSATDEVLHKVGMDPRVAGRGGCAGASAGLCTDVAAVGKAHG